MDAAVRELDKRIMAASAGAPKSPLSKDQLTLLRDEIVANRKGVYGSLLYDPTWVALLIPTGGFGLITVAIELLFGVTQEGGAGRAARDVACAARADRPGGLSAREGYRAPSARSACVPAGGNTAFTASRYFMPLTMSGSR